MTVQITDTNHGHFPAAEPAPEPTVQAPSAPSPSTVDGSWFAMIDNAQRHAAEAHAACQRMLIDSHLAFLRMTETSFAAMLGMPTGAGAAAPHVPVPQAAPAPDPAPVEPQAATALDVPVPEAEPEHDELHSAAQEQEDEPLPLDAVATTPVELEVPAPGEVVEDERVELTRLAVRTVPTPAPGLAMAALGTGPIAVTEDGAGVAGKVAEKLTANGVTATVVTEVPATARGVVFLGGLAEVGSPEDGAQVRRDAFHVARSVAERLTTDGGVFVTVQDTGGDFGLSGAEPERAWLGGIAALARTAAKEWPDASVKAIDCERGGRDAEEVADAIVAELLTGGPAAEVGLRADGTRNTTRAVPVAVSEEPDRSVHIGPDSVIVATGGARGITAAALADLARTHQPRIVLLGRTELVAEPEGLSSATDEAALTQALAERAEVAAPAALTAHARRILATREVRATLAELKRAGSPAMYVPVDVRHTESLASALAGVRAEWGPVTGIVHGAGVLAEELIANKTDEEFDEVLDTKVGGLRALLTATRADPLEVICLFSSVASVFGDVGRGDDAMANEVLNHVASAERARRPHCLVRSIAWGPWSGGAGPRDEAIPTELGAAAFTAELRDPGADTRIVVAAGSDLESMAARERPRSAEVRVSSRTHPYLVDHDVAGVAVLPVAMVLDWFVGAAAAWRPAAKGVVLRDLRVFNKIVLPRLGNGGHRLAVHGSGAPGGLSAELRCEDGLPRFRAELDTEPSEPRSDWTVPAGPARSEVYDGGLLCHGPGFQAIQTLHGVSPEGAEATVTGVGELGWQGETWQLDPAAVDGGLQVAAVWAESVLGHASLPMGVAECRVHRRGRIEDTARCVVKAGKVNDTGARCDLALIDPDGSPRVELFGVELVRRPD
ncbi:SDR family oxidoreductase [Allokutzneria oryzae]|uniref:SDR family oxidoreductase n=1 Tax=Allokutzneria oryzae TaxID=1378989 RepID=A0ABV5ZQK8_9PSEU